MVDGRDDREPAGSGQVMTVEQVAAYLQLNRLTVYRYIREGQIPATKIGKAYRVLRADLDRFLESRRTVSPTSPRRPAHRPSLERLPVPSGDRLGRGPARQARRQDAREIAVGPNHPDSILPWDPAIAPGGPYEWLMGIIH